MEDYKMGFVLTMGDSGKLKGVISNADVRRALLKHTGHLDLIRIYDIPNRNPICIDENATLGEMLRKIDALNFIILFLPVIDEDRRLKGAVLLNNLTRG